MLSQSKLYLPKLPSKYIVLYASLHCSLRPEAVPRSPYLDCMTM